MLADNEHYSVELFEWMSSQSPFDLLTPMPYNPSVLRAIHGLRSEAFTRHWAGYATAKQPYSMTRSHVVPTISLFNVKVNISKITTLKPSYAPVIEMKWKTFLSIILNDGT